MPRLASDDDDLVFVTSDGQLLRFAASAVRPQGRAAGGMAGIRLGGDAQVVFFGVVSARGGRRRRHASPAARPRCRAPRPAA